MMEYYPSLDATEPAPLDAVSHCNEMTVYDEPDGSRYLLTSSAHTTESSSNAYMHRDLL